MKNKILTFVYALFNLCVYSQDFSDRQIIKLPYDVNLEIIRYMDSLNRSGKHSCINIEYAYLDSAREIGDYGPMYYGDTIQVKQFGILLSYEYDRPNTNKTKDLTRSNEWHSTHRVFFPDKGTGN